MPPTKTAPIGPKPFAYRLGFALGLFAAPFKALAERRRLAAFIAANQARIGTGLDAVNYALDMDDRSDIALFLEDWRAGDLARWPDYRPPAKPKATLSPIGRLVRAAALLSGFMGALLFAGGFYDAALSPMPGDPIKNLLTLAWAAAMLVCAGASWRWALPRGEG